jgi:hypothetical protein
VGYGRFYNTLQVGNAHTDTMPDMRVALIVWADEAGVSSDKLIGTTVDFGSARQQDRRQEPEDELEVDPVM